MAIHRLDRSPRSGRLSSPPSTNIPSRPVGRLRTMAPPLLLCCFAQRFLGTTASGTAASNAHCVGTCCSVGTERQSPATAGGNEGCGCEEGAGEDEGAAWRESSESGSALGRTAIVDHELSAHGHALAHLHLGPGGGGQVGNVVSGDFEARHFC